MTKIGLSQINGVAVTAFVLCLVVGALLTLAMRHPAPSIIAGLLGIYLLFAIKVVRQWEKVALLRLGKYVGLRGPGLFHPLHDFTLEQAFRASRRSRPEGRAAA